ncbi:beta-galactosidase [Streptomyces sp. NPDC085481]|uniref:beta-galactosidase n=1 Tax=Streptomyces sp. NPDC085481 TaxID=3365727 RepID=UPI0037D7955D
MNRPRLRRPRLLALLAVLALVALVAATVGALNRDDTDPSSSFGTLQTAPERARTEYEHGLRVAHLQIDWGRFEPEQGVYDDSYIQEVRDRLHAFREAGLRVEAGLGLNHPPDWLAGAYPESVWRNQFGEESTGTPNIVFSTPVRDEVASYVRQVNERIGLDEIWAIRVGINESGEFGYPSPVADGRDKGEFWAYDRHAQEASPYPGWRPGEKAYEGAPFTERQVRRWYDWYLASLADAVDWQIDLFTGLGHHGPLKVLVPGSGFYPSDYRAAVSGYLDGTRSARLIGRGVGFFATLGLLQQRDEVHIVTTALVDGTGDPVDNGCAPGDPKAVATADGSAAADRAVRAWSSTRWVVAVARSEGFTHLDGESAGQHVAAYWPGVMEVAFHQFDSCGLEGLMWAFDHDLYDGTPGSSLAEYAAMIREREGRSGSQAPGRPERGEAAEAAHR